MIRCAGEPDLSVPRETAVAGQFDSKGIDGLQNRILALVG